MKILRPKIAAFMVVSMLATLAATPCAAGASPDTPTADGAYATEQAINAAWLSNDADALGSLLSDDWAVVSAQGRIGNKSSIIEGIKAGAFTRKTMTISDPRVRIYGDVAVITTSLKTSGTLMGKCFDVGETQTDVLTWQDGAWKSVLLHETKVPGVTTGACPQA